MKIEHILIDIGQGRKARRKAWESGAYIDDKFAFSLNYEDLAANDWELEQVGPMEIWVNIYDTGNMGIYRTKLDADTVGIQYNARTVKFREVIDE
jgi:hypothetical protein